MTGATILNLIVFEEIFNAAVVVALSLPDMPRQLCG